ncbi:hypothetical protein CRX42_03355 [Pseudomonas jessenii]|uniref:Uncharacterized protein n=1 Tax=Pseudomonas jessenii TaxID=77298 RepID=A0A2W0F452_PSEJE|nr:hypothetical protein CRX42_03355 [Pseudomonas jessenii]
MGRSRANSVITWCRCFTGIEGLVRLLWRGGLPPLGCEAAPKPADQVCLTYRVQRFYDCCAAERGQAPSPQDSR